jgi:hypothetical protein
MTRARTAAALRAIQLQQFAEGNVTLIGYGTMDEVGVCHYRPGQRPPWAAIEAANAASVSG